MEKTKERSQLCFEDFKIEEKLGRGGFAVVYKAEYYGESSYFPKYVAVKEISKTENKWEIYKRYAENEVKNHKDSRHPNIVKLYQCLEDDEKIWLILELCEETLEGYLKKQRQGTLRESRAYEIFKQIVEGVKYLHSKYTVHRDLTLRNILITKDEQVKIADFGLSTKLHEYDDIKYSSVGTRAYMPPEMRKKRGHTDKVDCWNLGCILHALLFGTIPKQQDELCYPDTITWEAKELLEGLLEKNPNKRMCIEAVPKSAFFKKHEELCRSQRDACRSRDSGNGSNNYTKEKKSPVRSWDSGFNSKDSDFRKKSHSAKKLPERPPYKKNVVINRYHTPIHEDSSFKDRKSCQPLSSNNASFQNRNRSRDSYKNRESWKNSDSCTDSTYQTHRSFNPEPINRFTDPSCRFNNSINEWHKVSSSPCGHDGFCDNKCSHMETCRCHYHSYQKHQLSDCTNPEKLIQDKLEQMPPLNAARLKPKRHYIKDRKIVVHISVDRVVILESLKIKKNKTYVSEVMAISTDGMEVKVYIPPKHSLLADNHPPLFPSDPLVVKSYKYPHIVESYWKKYLIAKKFVDTLRAKTPKLIKNGSNAKFYVMENTPDPDCRMDFYDGSSVLEKGKDIFTTHKSGKRVLESSKKALLDEFRQEKEICKFILGFHESLESPTFPIILGLVKSDSYGSGIKIGKENHAPLSSMASKYNRSDDR